MTCNRNTVDYYGLMILKPYWAVEESGHYVVKMLNLLDEEGGALSWQSTAAGQLSGHKKTTLHIVNLLSHYSSQSACPAQTAMPIIPQARVAGRSGSQRVTSRSLVWGAQSISTFRTAIK
jgi:hypothetical protein